MLRALSFNSCGPNSTAGGDPTCGLSLLLVLFSALKGLSLGITRFSSKTNTSRFKFIVFFFFLSLLFLFLFFVLVQTSTLAFTSSISPTGKCKYFITSETFPQLRMLSNANNLIKFLFCLVFLEMLVGKTFNVQIRVNETFLPGYTNLSFSESLTFIHNFTTKMKDVFRVSLPYFKQIEVKSLSNGSVWVDFDVEVYSLSNASTNAIERGLEDANGTESMGYQLIGNIIVQEVNSRPLPLFQPQLPR